MLENTDAAQLWLTFAGLAVSLFTLTILVLLFLLVKRALEPKSPVVSTAQTGAAGLIAARKEQVEAAKPGRSCGHCGVRIKGDPVRGVSLDTQSFLVFACPKCKKETLIPQ